MDNPPVMVGWKVLIKPKMGKTETESGIDISVTAEAEEHLGYVGEIVAMGESCFTAKTQGNIDMSQWKVRPQVGDQVLFKTYAGMRIRPKGEKKFLLLMNDTDIMAIIDDPDDYFAWVDV